jgi:hypothetical protein
LEKTKGAEPAQHLLARIARTNAGEVRAAAAALSKEQRAAVEKLAGAGGATREASAKGVASVAELPEVLRDPPWPAASADMLSAVDKVARAASRSKRSSQGSATPFTRSWSGPTATASAPTRPPARSR